MPQHTGKSPKIRPRAKYHPLKGKHRAAQFLAHRDDDLAERVEDSRNPSNRLEIPPIIEPAVQNPTFRPDKNGELTWVESAEYQPKAPPKSDKLANWRRNVEKNPDPHPESVPDETILFVMKPHKRHKKPAPARIVERAGNLEVTAPPTFKKR